jgi:hypothetical protein
LTFQYFRRSKLADIILAFLENLFEIDTGVIGGSGTLTLIGKSCILPICIIARNAGIVGTESYLTILIDEQIGWNDRPMD